MARLTVRVLTPKSFEASETERRMGVCIGEGEGGEAGKNGIVTLV
jgi:hypothetical protein